MSLSILIGSADFSALSFAFLQMLQEDEFDIICHGAVLGGGEDSDLLKNLLREPQGENTLVCGHLFSPVDRF